MPDIGIMVRVFANDPGDLGSIPGQVRPKTKKMVLDASLLNTQRYKVRIKIKVDQSWERSSALPKHLRVVAIEKGAFELPLTTVANFTYLYDMLWGTSISLRSNIPVNVLHSKKWLSLFKELQRVAFETSSSNMMVSLCK